MRRSLFLTGFGALLAAVVFIGAAAQAAEIYAWTQFTGEGLEARVVTSEAACPKAAIDGSDAQMNIRARPNGDFPALVCSLAIPKNAREASINGRPLALPPPRAQKILLIGDTGCRLQMMMLQACNFIKDWPFRLAADTAAEMAPDLVIHVGDLVYRERACPDSNKGCAGSPYGDNWDTWKADVFEPGRALLSAAPWVFIRGNHEDCDRSRAGWNRFASPLPFTEGTCSRQEPPYLVDLGGIALAVLDVTQAEDRAVNDALAPLFRQQFVSLAKTEAPLWIAMHKPIYASVRIKDGVNVGVNKTLAAATRGAVPANAQLLLSGHIHTFQAMSYSSDLPAQIVAGHGGTTLDRFTPEKLDGVAMDDAKVEKGIGLNNRFGFATLERRDDEWLLTSFGVHGEQLARCHLRGKKLDCEP
ncbi:metallophosphoesterase family protein [Methylocystis heyeri]|nr:metallophosphoesterase [Methylocystis heyeri]